MTKTASRVLIEATVDYVPATEPFHAKEESAATIEAVRQTAMTYFNVSDHQDRDTHKFWLEFDGRRLIDPDQTLEGLLGEHRKGAHFVLVEEITKGAS